tara:strand:+ start:58136 stop:58897 length:762 start_codon:yes stop_codon:yes gene_type:complete
MFKTAILILGLAVLSGCGDPLADVPRLADVELANGKTSSKALPTEDEIARDGFFGTDAARGNLPEGLSAPKPAKGGGLLGLFGGGSAQPEDASDDVAFGTRLPFGQVARVCAAVGEKLGAKVKDGSARGYQLFDSAPGGAGARTFYITGFSDGCPRQLTAANVLLGAPSFYEQLRYGPGGENLPYGETDKAYDTVKSLVCGAGRGKPCGRKIGKLDKTTFFVSAYEHRGDNARWSEVLVHDGAVMAAAVKSGG